MDVFLQEALREIREKGLERELQLVDGPQGARTRVNGRTALNFCSNNYLGLADDPRLKEAAVASIHREGVGAGASRLVCGHTRAHQRLEEEIARFKGAQRCLLFSSGYTANVGIISSLFGPEDRVFCDRLNHASIIDGILLSRVPFKRYAHGDMEALERLLQSGGGKKRAIITDSVFSMDGDLAPLPEIVRLARKYACWVMIDEAHALGVMGKTGKGLAEHFGVETKIDIQMGTLSKAAGCLGGYVCGSQALISFLIQKARSFIYTTALPPSVAASAQRAIAIMEEDPRRREQLWENTRYLQSGLRDRGFDTMQSQTPIIPVLLKESGLAVAFSRRLLQEGIWISAIRPPTVPQGTARLRLTVMATHTQEDIDELLGKMEKIGRELGVR